MSFYDDSIEDKSTVKERRFDVRLSDQDLLSLWKKAEGVGLTIPELLENFIADLTDGIGANGSDERMYIEQWFDRCGFNYSFTDSFFRYLIEYEELDDFMELLNEKQKLIDEIAEIEEQLKTGIIRRIDDKIYTWEDIVESNEQPAYKSKVAWEKETKEDLGQQRELLNDINEKIKESWNEFIELTGNKKLLFKDELQIVINKIEEYMKIKG